ncbi:domain found in Dishevelled [Drepanopeziza brunnea f. sp. 'multigermtubi' MB_m1]|uniref:Vacuolar membrane-associated protein IML1 n=1 Tax=Marssonina brunnea f. sp. multigermtubi (strain MB_m1) TaxID=1072389 RepID=K1WPN4_MARBU|nr:domain found in Dishevelled [Drepanopeziza brunnea f. sp. 'multigermtubi' MB_m1]EKD14941.1 domain found in Dishevelled [Drepanopeziza brunnea f. sp. 'multigermtubi' MB_m1]
MLSASSSTPRRGTQRSSHLREVSNGSPEATVLSRPLTATSDTGTVQHDPVPVTVKTAVERRCTLWVHDEGFSREEVVLNLDLFTDVKPGELMAIMALKTDSVVRDFQDKTQSFKRDSVALGAPMQRERSASNPRSPASGKDAKHDVDRWKRYLFIAKDISREMKAKHQGLEVSVTKYIADAFGLKHRSNVILTTTDQDENSASHVELSFKDEYLARSDMWRLTVAELSNKTVFKSQKILFMGTIKAQVTAVYVDGRKVQSAFFSTTSKPIFRSESARYVLFIQMSKEMWDFDSEGSGEIMFNKVVNGFLPALFKKWASLKAKHLVSIVLFTRMEYDTGIASELATSAHDSSYHTGVQIDANKKPYKDFYRVVVSEMASGSWTTILYQLKREFKFFRKDISMHRINIVNALEASGETNTGGVLGTRIEANPSLAMHGNVLEAINLASRQFSHDYIDRDLMRTGISIVVITPCPGLFEVDYETLRLTTENLIGNGIGIDLVCLPKMPLHSVPLFRYRNPLYAAFQEAIHFKALRSEESTPRQNASMFGSSFSSLNESVSPSKSTAIQQERQARSGSVASFQPPSEWSYAIPHWLDVSFWTGASQDIHIANPLAKPHKRLFKTSPVERASDFEVRCKMYEMEMASVMENAMTEIAVTPLQLDALFPQMILGPRETPGKKLAPDTLSAKIKREKTYGGLSEVINGPLKPLTDKHSPSENERFFRALEVFDIMRSQISEDFSGGRHNIEGKKYFKPSSEEAVKKPLAEDPKVFGTSSSDEHGTLKGTGFLSVSPAGKSTLESKHTEYVTRPRKESVVSTMTNTSTRTSPVRPVRSVRQISLGKYGFGIAAPKAATAEIQIEHAKAAKPVSGTAKNTGSMMNGSAEMANRFLVTASSHGINRPPSSQSNRSKKSLESLSTERKAVPEKADADKSSSSRPITIKSALQSLDQTNQLKSRSVLGSLYEAESRRTDDRLLQSARQDDNQKLFNSKLLAGAVPELPATLSPTRALSPWLTVLNPSNPSENSSLGPTPYTRWQHVFPRPVLTKTMKWKSLCSPASVPLTTEYFPTKHQLDTEYQQKPYNIAQNLEEDLNEISKDREELLRELIGLRLSHGFQIVVGPGVAQAFGQKSMRIANVFEPARIAEDGASVFMSMGSIIHQLSCVNETEVEINTFIRKPTAATSARPGAVIPSAYNPAIRTALARDYDSRLVVLGKPKDEYNWNYVDAFIAGLAEEMSENLRFWRARFVLIPAERPTQTQMRQGEDNEEEIRLEGIKKITLMWQKHRVLTASERRFQSVGSQKLKGPNPLDIVYKTEDPSVVVTAELETLPLVEAGDPNLRRGKLLETERFRKSKLDIAGLAEAIQRPVERGGVRMQNRRWHFRLHYNCFIGSDMTTWLMENFEDIDTREEAVELGNLLMANDELQKIREGEVNKDTGKDKDKDMGIFVHVEKRHPFRDGQFFYQVTGEFAKQRPESGRGWFATKRRDPSIPTTPITESMPRDPPRPERSRSGSNHDDMSNDSGATTPPAAGGIGTGKRPKVALSKVMKYDVDHRKRSYRPEIIHLHYDRLHNPDNCYHIRIEWMGVTAKLIEDALGSWASTAERYGLRLVEAPIGEVCSITAMHPFRSPYIIKLAAQPPNQQPRTYFDVNSFGPQVQTCQGNRQCYQKAIMKKFNFVLDTEAAKNFPSNVDVTYSWGKPNFKYTQYIHRSGVVLAQITDDGNFLLLANRLYNNRTMASREPDRYVKSGLHAENNSTRMVSSLHGHGGYMSDKLTPVNSPMLRSTFTTTTTMGSPLLRATSDVLGPGPPGSKLANPATPDSIRYELEAFCHNTAALEAFYKEVLEKATPPSATPPAYPKSPFMQSVLDANIPTLGLPPGLLARDSSPSPMRLSSLTSMSMPPSCGRRQSVQFGISGASAGDHPRQESPGGSIAEDR